MKIKQPYQVFVYVVVLASMVTYPYRTSPIAMRMAYYGYVGGCEEDYKRLMMEGEV